MLVEGTNLDIFAKLKNPEKSHGIKRHYLNTKSFSVLKAHQCQQTCHSKISF